MDNDNDNEKWTDEDIQEIEQARRELANGETTSLEELKRALKISGWNFKQSKKEPEKIR